MYVLGKLPNYYNLGEVSRRADRKISDPTNDSKKLFVESIISGMTKIIAKSC